MKIELATPYLEALVAQTVRECLRQQKNQERQAERVGQGGTLIAPRKVLLTSSEAAKFLGISQRTLFELKRTGELAYVPISSGGKKQSIRYDIRDLEALIKRRKTFKRE